MQLVHERVSALEYATRISLVKAWRSQSFQLLLEVQKELPLLCCFTLYLQKRMGFCEVMKIGTKSN